MEVFYQQLRALSNFVEENEIPLIIQWQWFIYTCISATVVQPRNCVWDLQSTVLKLCTAWPIILEVCWPLREPSLCPSVHMPGPPGVVISYPQPSSFPPLPLLSPWTHSTFSLINELLPDTPHYSTSSQLLFPVPPPPLCLMCIYSASQLALLSPHFPCREIWLLLHPAPLQQISLLLQFIHPCVGEILLY